jgi:ABC-type transporter Mla MlaB component
MADSKDNSSFFRKVVRFVANPTTDWAEVGSSSDELRETEFAKSELKAMIERKRRNDFVRKREFDMLRKVRREGLTAEQLAALGGSSKLDDSEGKLQIDAGPESDVKEKIDAIERQMVGDSSQVPLGRAAQAPAPPPAARHSGFYNAPTEAMPLPASAAPPSVVLPPPLPPPEGGRVVDTPELPPSRPPSTPLPPLQFDMHGGDDFAVEVNEVAHDPELDEAVISFANADFEACENALGSLISPGGPRHAHAETWLVLFDLYRATGQQQRFESLALDYAQAFGWSAPQWFSMPRLVAEAAAEEKPRSAAQRISGDVGWVCPEVVDVDEVARLGSQTLHMPLPWVFDWSRLRSIDTEACARLSELFRSWMPQKIDMRWIGGEHLLSVLAEAAPTGVRDADPAFWQLRLDSLRMANRADQFDEVAIDYCVTYEVSPPSFERVACQVRISDTGTTTAQPAHSQVSDATTSFLESRLSDDAGGQIATFELSGQLIGDIGATLRTMEASLQASTVVEVSCAKLIRVDFVAAGDLLNWVLSRRSENRAVTFTESHRLVALFFGAMGIGEHAKVKVRTV